MAQNQTTTTVTTTTQKQQFPSSETRNTLRFNALSGAGDETSSRNDESILKKKIDDMCSNLLKKSRGMSSSSSLYGAHPGIGKDELVLADLDQVDKLNNWGEFQNVLDSIKNGRHNIE
jgi:hypothetical protein